MPPLPQKIEFSGTIHHALDISAIVAFQVNGTSYLAIGSDESEQQVQLLRQVSDHTYAVDDERMIHLPTPEEPDEIDIESLAFDPKQYCLYITGSHSKKRKKVKVDSQTVAENLERLAEIQAETHRNQIFQVNLNPDTGAVAGKIQQNDALKDILAKDIYLKGFVDLPSKENGLDIEGLAFQEGKLFLGCRGPILRGNYVPVIVTPFDDFPSYEIRFVQLDGNGIRDMTAVQGGFLLIAGPMGDASGPYHLYFWDGSDMVYGTDRPPPMPPGLVHLEAILPPVGTTGSQGKPEGITILEETPTAYTAMIVYDSLRNGNPECWHIPKR